MAVEANIPVETEVFGVTYERFALQRLFARLTSQLNLHSVVEMPASGAKAMSSLYSLGFALAGCRVALVNADPEAIKLWYQLDLGDRLTLLREDEIERECATGHCWDLCWNFAVLPTAENPEALIQRMANLSRHWLLVIGVNRFNVGFPFHRAVHRRHQIPWTHGDLRFLSPFSTFAFFQSLGFKEIRWGLVDCPPWPDSLGFRDLRLHRRPESLFRWHSPYLEHLRNGKFPRWMQAVYGLERLPLPIRLKLPYAHLFYVLCRVDREIT
jgi:hypothetical protein